MSSRRSFIDLCVQGEVRPDEIDDFIDRWHQMPEGKELDEFLGMTGDEYALWLRIPDALPAIIKARLGSRPLTEMVARTCEELRQAAESDDRTTAARLQNWLQEKARPG